MPEKIKLLTSRRGYEFSLDDLRLSTISTKPVLNHIEQMFQFQVSAIGSPIPTFGEVPATIPPGIVFNSGVWASSNGYIVPIRFLHFEQYRIVIDVSGASSVIIDEIFEQLVRALSEVSIPDGSPIIGKPERVLDYSEISAQFSFPLEAVFVPPLRELLHKRVVASASEKDVVLVPTLALRSYSSKQEIVSTPVSNEFHTFTFALRAKTKFEERVYFSAAPLDSETHLSYIKELEEALTPE